MPCLCPVPQPRGFQQVRLQDFQGGASLGTWLARIAINLALDVLRRRGRSVPTDCAQDVDHEPSPEHMMSFSAPHSASPESAAARTELRALLQSAIEGLPPIYRSVFMLRAVQESSVTSFSGLDRRPLF